MSTHDVHDLGAFTATELRVGGIGQRGFLQPLMAARRGPEEQVEVEAVSDLSRRGLMVASGAGWRPIGRFLCVLNAAGAGRSFVACPPAADRDAPRSAAPVAGPERLWFGQLGDTDRVLDLCPSDSGYQSRLIGVERAVVDLAAWSGSASAPASADLVPAVTEGSEEWTGALADGRLTGPALRMETASVAGPATGLLQQRLHIFRSGADRRPWILVGTQQGGRTSQASAPAGPARVARALRQVLTGELVLL